MTSVGEMQFGSSLTDQILVFSVFQASMHNPFSLCVALWLSVAT